MFNFYIYFDLFEGETLIFLSVSETKTYLNAQIEAVNFTI